MKFTVTFYVLSTCMLLTGCTGLDLNSKSNLAFYEPDPFLTNGGLTGDNYPTEPISSGPVGIARIMDSDMSQAPLAEYPAVADVAMPLLPGGAGDIKPTGSLSQVPGNLSMDDETNRPKVVKTSNQDVINFGTDPFAGQDDDADAPLMVATIDQSLTTISSQDFAPPVRPSSVVETVAVPVDDAVSIPTRTALKPAEFHTSGSTEATASSVGWRATR